jgi:hypothetical protein
MTAEYPVGRYFTRLTAIDQTFGTADDHLRFLGSKVPGHSLVKL